MKGFRGIQDTAKEIAFFTLSLAFAFVIFMGAVIVYGAFREAPEPQPAEPLAVSGADLIDKGNAPQEKRGSIVANEFWVDAIDWYADRFPYTKINRARMPWGGSGNITVYCDFGYKLIGCGGGMRPDALEGGCPNDNCGNVGVIPIDKNGNRSATNATGCKVGVDGHDGNQAPTVDAYCMRANP